MTEKTFDAAELASLASEACNLWQEHLNACANDPAAHTEMLRLLEPQRQLFSKLFADYGAMMQTGAYASAATQNQPVEPTAAANAATNAAAADSVAPAHTAASRPAPAADAFDDSALRLAQLAYRVAELERRIAGLESHFESELGFGKSARPARAAKSVPKSAGDTGSDE